MATAYARTPGSIKNVTAQPWADSHSRVGWAGGRRSSVSAKPRCAGKSRSELLDSARRENCELTAQLGFAINASKPRTAPRRHTFARAGDERTRIVKDRRASPTVRGGRHSRATCHFGFSRSKQAIQNVGLPALFHQSGRQTEFRLPESFG